MRAMASESSVALNPWPEVQHPGHRYVPVTPAGDYNICCCQKKKKGGGTTLLFPERSRSLCELWRGLGSELRPLMYSGVTTKTRCSSPGPAHYSPPPSADGSRTGAESWPRCSTGRSSCCHDDRWKTKVESSSLSSHLNPFARSF